MTGRDSARCRHGFALWPLRQRPRDRRARLYPSSPRLLSTVPARGPSSSDLKAGAAPSALLGPLGRTHLTGLEGAGGKRLLTSKGMRIVAGRFRGRRLAVPKDARVRPAADRVREAWMSIVGPSLPDAQVADLYAGSGALGLEALSRGARSVDFVELAPGALAALRANIEALGVGEAVRVHRAD